MKKVSTLAALLAVTTSVSISANEVKDVEVKKDNEEVKNKIVDETNSDTSNLESDKADVVDEKVKTEQEGLQIAGEIKDIEEEASSSSMSIPDFNEVKTSSKESVKKQAEEAVYPGPEIDLNFNKSSHKSFAFYGDFISFEQKFIYDKQVQAPKYNAYSSPDKEVGRPMEAIDPSKVDVDIKNTLNNSTPAVVLPVPQNTTDSLVASIVPAPAPIVVTKAADTIIANAVTYTAAASGTRYITTKAEAEAYRTVNGHSYIGGNGDKGHDAIDAIDYLGLDLPATGAINTTSYTIVGGAGGKGEDGGWGGDVGWYGAIGGNAGTAGKGSNGSNTTGINLTTETINYGDIKVTSGKGGAGGAGGKGGASGAGLYPTGTPIINGNDLIKWPDPGWTDNNAPAHNDGLTGTNGDSTDGEDAGNGGSAIGIDTKGNILTNYGNIESRGGNGGNGGNATAQQESVTYGGTGNAVSYGSNQQIKDGGNAGNGGVSTAIKTTALLSNYGSIKSYGGNGGIGGQGGWNLGGTVLATGGIDGRGGDAKGIETTAELNNYGILTVSGGATGRLGVSATPTSGVGRTGNLGGSAYGIFTTAILNNYGDIFITGSKGGGGETFGRGGTSVLLGIKDIIQSGTGGQGGFASGIYSNNNITNSGNIKVTGGQGGTGGTGGWEWNSGGTSGQGGNGGIGSDAAGITLSGSSQIVKNTANLIVKGGIGGIGGTGGRAIDSWDRKNGWLDGGQAGAGGDGGIGGNAIGILLYINGDTSNKNHTIMNSGIIMATAGEAGTAGIGGLSDGVGNNNCVDYDGDTPPSFIECKTVDNPAGPHRAGSIDSVTGAIGSVGTKGNGYGILGYGSTISNNSIILATTNVLNGNNNTFNNYGIIGTEIGGSLVSGTGNTFNNYGVSVIYNNDGTLNQILSSYQGATNLAGTSAILMNNAVASNLSSKIINGTAIKSTLSYSGITITDSIINAVSNTDAGLELTGGNNLINNTIINNFGSALSVTNSILQGSNVALNSVASGLDSSKYVMNIGAAGEVTLSDSSINGSVNMTLGDNTLYNALYLNNSSISGKIVTGLGANTIGFTNMKYLTNDIDMSLGNDVLILDNAEIKKVVFGAGNNTFDLTNSIYNDVVDMGGGNNKVVLSDASSIKGVVFSDGNDTFEMNNNISTLALDFKNGANNIKLDNSILTSDVKFGNNATTVIGNLTFNNSILNGGLTIGTGEYNGTVENSKITKDIVSLGSLELQANNSIISGGINIGKDFNINIQNSSIGKDIITGGVGNFTANNTLIGGGIIFNRSTSHSSSFITDDNSYFSLTSSEVKNGVTLGEKTNFTSINSVIGGNITLSSDTFIGNYTTINDSFHLENSKVSGDVIIGGIGNANIISSVLDNLSIAKDGNVKVTGSLLNGGLTIGTAGVSIVGDITLLNSVVAKGINVSGVGTFNLTNSFVGEGVDISGAGTVTAVNSEINNGFNIGGDGTITTTNSEINKGISIGGIGTVDISTTSIEENINVTGDATIKLDTVLVRKDVTVGGNGNLNINASLVQGNATAGSGTIAFKNSTLDGNITISKGDGTVSLHDTAFGGLIGGSINFASGNDKVILTTNKIGTDLYTVDTNIDFGTGNAIFETSNNISLKGNVTADANGVNTFSMGTTSDSINRIRGGIISNFQELTFKGTTIFRTGTSIVNAKTISYDKALETEIESTPTGVSALSEKWNADLSPKLRAGSSPVIGDAIASDIIRNHGLYNLGIKLKESDSASQLVIDTSKLRDFSRVEFGTTDISDVTGIVANDVLHITEKRGNDIYVVAVSALSKGGDYGLPGSGIKGSYMSSDHLNGVYQSIYNANKVFVLGSEAKVDITKPKDEAVANAFNNVYSILDQTFANNPYAMARTPNLYLMNKFNKMTSENSYYRNTQWNIQGYTLGEVSKSYEKNYTSDGRKSEYDLTNGFYGGGALFSKNFFRNVTDTFSLAFVATDSTLSHGSHFNGTSPLFGYNKTFNNFGYNENSVDKLSSNIGVSFLMTDYYDVSRNVEGQYVSKDTGAKFNNKTGSANTGLSYAKYINDTTTLTGKYNFEVTKFWQDSIDEEAKSDNLAIHVDSMNDTIYSNHVNLELRKDFALYTHKGYATLSSGYTYNDGDLMSAPQANVIGSTSDFFLQGNKVGQHVGDAMAGVYYTNPSWRLGATWNFYYSNIRSHSSIFGSTIQYKF